MVHNLFEIDPILYLEKSLIYVSIYSNDFSINFSSTHSRCYFHLHLEIPLKPYMIQEILNEVFVKVFYVSTTLHTNRTFDSSLFLFALHFTKWTLC
jgi:hypothetical protein